MQVLMYKDKRVMDLCRIGDTFQVYNKDLVPDKLKEVLNYSKEQIDFSLEALGFEPREALVHSYIKEMFIEIMNDTNPELLRITELDIQVENIIKYQTKDKYWLLEEDIYILKKQYDEIAILYRDGSNKGLVFEQGRDILDFVVNEDGTFSVDENKTKIYGLLVNIAASFQQTFFSNGNYLKDLAEITSYVKNPYTFVVENHKYWIAKE